MEDHKKYLDDLSDIKNIMERSSRFLSLNGLSGIIVGIYALIGAGVAYRLLDYENGFTVRYITLEQIKSLILIAVTVLVASLLTSIFLTYRKAKKHKQQVFGSQAKRLLINMLIPLVTGAAFVLILIERRELLLAAPATLIFYGLALVNASKYTLHDIRYLGLLEIALGLLASYFVGYGLFFWSIGFGLLHIIYYIWIGDVFEI